MAILRFLWTTGVGGVVVILPVALLTAGVWKAVEVVRGALAPMAGWFPDTLPYPTLVAIGAVVSLCFAAGLLLRTALGRAAGRQIEGRLLRRIPGYTLFRTLSRRLGGEDGREMAVALVRQDDHDVLGFVMERLSGGRSAIFVPSTPTPAVGSLLIVTDDRVRILGVSMRDAVACLSQWGSGAAGLLSLDETRSM